MAELHVVKKKKSPLLWVLLALLILGLIAYLLLRNEAATPDATPARADSAMGYDSSRPSAP